VQPLGFGFDVDAVALNGVAHRPDCQLVPPVLPHEAMLIPAAGVYRSTGARASARAAGLRSRRSSATSSTRRWSARLTEMIALGICAAAEQSGLVAVRV
jgi:hypothetical protein